MLLNDTTKQLFEDKLLLLIHHHADVDAVASAIALQTVFEEAVICAPDKVSSHGQKIAEFNDIKICLLYTSPSPRDRTRSRMPSSA